jgi:hypothetical protein
MEPAYLDQVSPDIQGLIRQVEDAMGVEIEVCLDNSVGYLQVNFGQQRPRIFTPRPNHFPDGSVAHEVLHIRRFRVEGIPQVVDDPEHPDENEQLEDALRAMDNSLEHLIIVPQELAMRPQRREWWESNMERAWNTRIPALEDVADRRRFALINWPFLVDVLPSARALPVAQRLLAQLDIADKAQQMRAELAAALHSKETMVHVCFKYLELDRALARFKYLDRHTGLASTVPI